MGLSLCGEMTSKILLFNQISVKEEEMDFDEQPMCYEQTVSYRRTSHVKLYTGRPRKDELSLCTLSCNLSTPVFNSKERAKSDVMRQRIKLGDASSMRQKIQERLNNSSTDFIRGECEAKLVVAALERSGKMHLSHAINLTQSMILKGDDMIDELAAQGEIIHNARYDMLNCEHDLHDIKGMLSTKGKVENMVSKQPKDHYNDDCFPKKGILRRTSSVPDILNSYLHGETKHPRLQGEVKQLGKNLDILYEQLLDIKKGLKHEEKPLGELANSIDRVDENIERQTSVMNRIMKPELSRFRISN